MSNAPASEDHDLGSQMIERKSNELCEVERDRDKVVGEKRREEKKSEIDKTKSKREKEEERERQSEEE